MLDFDKLPDWRRLFLNFPVAVNNFYGDPLIQWRNTCQRLDRLLAQRHQGPVALITKGAFTSAKIAYLQKVQAQGLRLIVLVSISELPDYEKVAQAPRYRNIAMLYEAGIPTVAYVRPMTPPLNTSPEVIDRIMKGLVENHARTVCLAGFRGDDVLVKDMNPDDKIRWTMRVKLLTGDVYSAFKEKCQKAGIRLFVRTSCAAASELKLQRSWNPYYNSPNLCHCSELDCPLIETCRAPDGPAPHSLEVLDYLGFDYELQNAGCSEKCSVRGDQRLSCPSCCTTCYMLKNPRIYVKNSNVNLGTLTFIRFLTGMLSVKKGLHDDGSKEIGFVHFPNFPEIDDFVCINTWTAYAQHGDRCFDCSYCIEKYYRGRSCNTTPLDLLGRIVEHEV